MLRIHERIYPLLSFTGLCWIKYIFGIGFFLYAFFSVSLLVVLATVSFFSLPLFCSNLSFFFSLFWGLIIESIRSSRRCFLEALVRGDMQVPHWKEVYKMEKTEMGSGRDFVDACSARASLDERARFLSLRLLSFHVFHVWYLSLFFCIVVCLFFLVKTTSMVFFLKSNLYNEHKKRATKPTFGSYLCLA